MILVTKTATALSTLLDVLVRWGGQKATLGTELVWDKAK